MLYYQLWLTSARVKRQGLMPCRFGHPTVGRIQCPAAENNQIDFWGISAVGRTNHQQLRPASSSSYRRICTKFGRDFWGISAVGSARHSHCRGQRFESAMLHTKPRHFALVQTAEKRHVFKRGYGVLAYSKEIKQEKIALTIRFIFWTAAVRKDCSYMLRIPSMRA